MANYLFGRAKEGESSTLLSPREAYDLCADHYDEWTWQKFWRRNEWPKILRLVRQADRDTHILDVGVGTGYYLSRLVGGNRTAVGLDISPKMIQKAQDRLGQTAKLVVADANAIPFSNGLFDIVLLNRVASHVQDLEGLIAEVSRVIRQNGVMIASDLSSEHRYSVTTLPSKDGDVPVETYKHSAVDWDRAISIGGLVKTCHRQLSVAELDWLPPEGLKSIDRTGVRPVGFILTAQPA